MIASGKYTRSFKPRWSDHIHVVRGFDGAEVVNDAGKAHLTKFTQPVPEGTTDSSGAHGATRIEQKRSTQTEEKIMQPFVDKVLDLLPDTEADTIPLGTRGPEGEPPGLPGRGQEGGHQHEAPDGQLHKGLPRALPDGHLGHWRRLQDSLGRLVC